VAAQVRPSGEAGEPCVGNRTAALRSFAVGQSSGRDARAPALDLGQVSTPRLLALPLVGVVGLGMEIHSQAAERPTASPTTARMAS
jgi:hypothetical protein